ncbi:Leucine-rich repeat-containing G-protein coupled receptor 4 [Holothuria leucospilota]|uniref:Leucine-rich repeat-containing G-protein coupled receptor 4 n=1 Tax=Holothuria leucospilota TaxID=206669 RepID=A0A9Q1C410_HOLLE|nr:Leucine-rich repeat-containing G-protein coupled receptor 4 [Holothuria leucospilota]
MESCKHTQYFLVVILLQLSSTFQISVSSATKEKGNCTYNDWGKEVSCRQTGLVSIPTLSGPVKILDISDNKITQLTNQTFVMLPFLEHLDLSNNRLGEINDGTFGKYSRGTRRSLIKFLDLSENELSKIENNAFKMLSSLSELYLNDNLLTDMTKNVLGHLRSLEILWLSKNKLTHLPHDTFQGKGDLLSLFLDRNKFAILPDSIFRGCWSLEVINLSGNQLQHAPASLKDLPSLRYLYLSNNRLIDISPVTFHLWALETLTIEKNFLQCSCNLEQVQQWMFRKGVLHTNSDNICYQSDNTSVNLSTLSTFCQERSKIDDSDFRTFGGKVEYTIIVREDLIYYNSVLLTCLTLMSVIWFLSYLFSRKVTRHFRRRLKNGKVELM